ncbi:MAG: hypothetical protein KGD57_10705 [Candidatus Lokiarchaeota archaeon]|nr:hypothetical protein [Candidatus Lokiarchaeota archaeon]
MLELEIRHAIKEDFPDVFILLKQLLPEKKFDEDKLKKVFRKGINSKDDEYLCVILNNNLVL